MEIRELLLKNFGKFAGKKVSLSEGINLLYGENESGKSTIHTFIRGMLFGMERGRGRAALSDTFSRYEPWENPNYYSGEMRFEVGGKNFLLSRNFDKYAKSVTLICEEDAEELSVQDGDLTMLLDGLTMQTYDNTLSMAQMKAAPGMSLAAELKNYATNYYAAGDSELDLNAAIETLLDRKKEAERQIKELSQQKQLKREKTEQEMSYIWRDIHRLTQEQESLKEEVVCRKNKQRESDAEQRGVIDEIRPAKWRVHPLEILGSFLIIVGAAFFIPKPWNYLVAIVLALCFGIYIWNRMKVSKKEEKTEPEKILEEITPDEEKASLAKLLWELERGTEELKEKQVQYNNLVESLEEIDEVTDEYKSYDRQREAAQMAMDKIMELSEELQKKLRVDLNARVSEIISEITDGKYTKLLVGEGLDMSLMSEGRRVSMDQVSQGTVEQIYFALRMAVIEVLHEEEYPVVLDDAFVSYDDKRLMQTLLWLHKNKKQVLLFTCQKREEEVMVKMGIPYHRVTI